MLEELDQLVGLVSSEEGRQLYRLAYESLDGAIVEVGSHKGKSTCYLAQGVVDRAAESEMWNTVYAVDLWTTGKNDHWNKPEIYADFLRQTKPYEPILVPLMGESVNIAKGWKTPISLLFIDANHHYAQALADYLAWSKFLIPGGTLVYDDVNKTPVQRVLKRITDTGLYEPWKTVGKVSWTRREV